MRAAFFAITAFGLAGCGHLYGAGDVALTDTQAIEIARNEAARRHIPLDGLTPLVGRFDTGVSIWFESSDCLQATCLDGGLPHFFIPAGKRRVSYVRTAY